MRYDLNLFRVFSVLMAEQNVTSAARRLGLGQPAVSAALGRLRVIFNDQLFIRARYGMTPTDKALQVAAMIDAALSDLDNAVAVGSVFEPLASRRVFHVVASEYAELAVVPRLVSAVSAQAPGIRISMTPLGADLDPNELGAGRADLALGRFDAPPDTFVTSEILRDSFICLLRRTDAADATQLTRERYESLRHVAVVPPGRLRTGVFRLVREHGMRREIRATVTGFLQAALVVAEAGLCATVPMRIGMLFADDARFALVPPPVSLGRFPTHLAWHPRHRHDAGHAWLRQLIRES
jgi:DNA-binding transcriptional LysR family regulator